MQEQHMTQSADLMKPRLLWADRGMVQYLHAVGLDSTFNTQIAKVYYQAGHIYGHPKPHADQYASKEEIDRLIAERKEYLEQKVVEYVVRRLDQSLTGET